MATIQTGNEGSFANARRWATQIFGKLTIPVFRVAQGQSTPPGMEIREPRDDSEWAEAAAGLDRFEAEWNLRRPETRASLRKRTERTFAGERFLRYFVAVQGDRIANGYELFEGARLQTLVVEHVPVALRALNLLLRVLPRDGELRASTLARVWYLPGRDDVARALWAHARSASAASGNAVSTQFDLRCPLRKLIPVRPWTPKATASVAVRSPLRLSEKRVLSPP
jgi:hypothetical protein